MNKIRQFLTILLFGYALSVFGAVVPSSSQQLELKPGWNLVTLTRPIVKADVSKFLDLKPMTLDIKMKCYVRCASADDIQIGVGYWVFAGEEVQSVELTQDLSQASWETTALRSGWNFIGVSDNSTWMNQTVEIWQWLNETFQKIPQTELTLGKAYWINTKEIGESHR